MKKENINLEKLLGEDIEPDEKIIYTTSAHWSLLLGSLFLLIVPLNSITKYGFMDLFIHPIGIFLLLFSTAGILLYFNLKVILTNKRYIKSIGIKHKGLPLGNIIQVKGYTNIIGGGKLFIERSQYPNKLMPSINMINNVKELEFKINEQLKKEV